MSDEIRVGDVCEIFASCCETSARIVGGEVTVRAFWGDVVGCKCQSCGTIIPGVVSVDSNIVIDGHHRVAWVPLKFLRKKRPPADESQWIRQETVPREEFDRWREQIRRGARIGETV